MKPNAPNKTNGRITVKEYLDLFAINKKTNNVESHKNGC